MFSDAQPVQQKKHHYLLFGIILLVVILCVGYFSLVVILKKLNQPPTQFPIKTDITIENGLSLEEIGLILEEQHVIKSAIYFQYIVRTNFADQFVQAGTYFFDKPLSTTDVAGSIINGINVSPLLKITFPEGFQTKDFYSFLPDTFTEDESIELSQYEGYLFPDTYFVRSDMTIPEIVSILRETFTEKITPYMTKIDETQFSLEDTIILASILEREANDLESKKIVSGILQNRLAINMPLQIDASFDYLFDKASSEVTESDLDHDSPYNSYLYTGLPPAPIANPGIESIEAVLEPTPSEYLFYLTDDEGVFHYAKNFEQHKVNKERYLR